MSPEYSNVESDKLRQAVEMSLQDAGYLNANPAAATGGRPIPDVARYGRLSERVAKRQVESSGRLLI